MSPDPSPVYRSRAGAEPSSPKSAHLVGRDVDSSAAPSPAELASHLALLREAVRDLSDGRWDPRRDPIALATVLGSLSGLISGAVLILRALGVLP